jgi:outer membrane receptor for monomeric catechols
MTNDELAAAIQVASERLDQTTSDHARMWREHLAALLKVQAERAETSATDAIKFRRWPPPTATDPLSQRTTWNDPVP